MNSYSRLVSIITLLFLVNSCANYHKHLSKDVQDWNEQELPDPQKIKHTVFLIGDVGNATLGS